SDAPSRAPCSICLISIGPKDGGQTTEGRAVSQTTPLVPQKRPSQRQAVRIRWTKRAITQEDLMNRLLACSPLAAALALASCDGTATAPPLRPSFDAGGGQGVNLHAGGFGEASFAAWKSQQGLPDTKGNGNFALYFQKLTTTATNAAAFAVITGFEGQDVSTLTLSWDHRTDGWCGAGAPRWNLRITGHSGASYLVF